MKERKKYIQLITQFINDANKQICILVGGREVGKTTLLKQTYNQFRNESNVYFISFEEEAIAKQFSNKDEFLDYFRLKFGVQFDTFGYLFLNEIQYSLNLLSILKDLFADKNNKIKIIGTATALRESTEIFDKNRQFIHVHPLDFYEFLERKNLHPEMLDFHNLSKIIITELHKLFEEYLQRGGYPSVVLASNQFDKQEQLKVILNKVFHNDVKFYFSGSDIIHFEKRRNEVISHNGKLKKIGTFTKKLGISRNKVEEFFRFAKKNFLIYSVSPLYQDKTREHSHSEVLYFGDPGLLRMSAHGNGTTVYKRELIESFVFMEILKNKLSKQDWIYTYRKLNNSILDFVYKHNQRYVPIYIDTNNSLSIPKVMKGFGEKFTTTMCIKVVENFVGKQEIKDKEYYYIPPFFISQVVEKIDLSKDMI